MKDNISRIEIFCEDSKVGAVQRLLAAVGVMNVVSQPVTNAKFKKGKVEAASSGSLLDMFVAYAKEHKLRELTPTAAREFMSYAGRKPAGYSVFLAQAQKAGLLKKVKGSKGKNTKYTVVKK